MTSARQFGFSSTTGDVLAGIDLTGKTAVVTGGASGLGAETARSLAAAGAAVTIGCRDRAKGRRVAASIAETSDAPAVQVLELELTDHDSIRRFAEDLRGSHDALDILVNNAGVMGCPLARTSQGWELQFATNHVGHFELGVVLRAKR